ncbi:hypothetical protein DY000_02001531 [Brassica cretica]|uniref:Uncharacterized protein n=1 Tax=Brassica cretica TaxID=69181 RepID=A0ABQ7CGM4_BRACR|nr:hypothetical protein DY000_02001531 [Brassica cretica]
MAVSKVPNHTRTPFLFGSLISAAYLPQGLLLTPLMITLFSHRCRSRNCDGGKRWLVLA